MDESPIVFQQVLPASRSVVWEAITNPEKMRQWYFDSIRAFRPEVGFETQFDVEADGTIYRHIWRVTEVEPFHRLTYSWTYEGLEGEAATVWALSELDGQTHLELTHRGTHTFPRDDPAFSRENGVGAWQYFLAEQLPAFLSRTD